MSIGGALARGDDPHYQAFFDAVAASQITEWLPAEPGQVLDLSPGRGVTDLLRARGHRVQRGPDRLPRLPAESVDAVVAEGLDGALCLAAEVTFESLARVLRPGGRLLVRVESQVAGLGELAGQGRWAELADVPNADVLLVPDEERWARRCFSPKELAESLSGASMSVHWVRPRTVLTPEAVHRMISTDRARLPELVGTELALAAQRAGESLGHYLVAAAVKTP